MAASILTLLRRNYPSVAKELLIPLLSLIGEAEAKFGDLDKFHILLAVALRTAQHPDVGKLSVEEVVSGAVDELPSLHTNVHSISLSTGLPEETVRRKVKALVEQGWLQKYDHSLLYSSKAIRELGPIRNQILKLSAANYRTISRLLEHESS